MQPTHEQTPAPGKYGGQQNHIYRDDVNTSSLHDTATKKPHWTDHWGPSWRHRDAVMLRDGYNYHLQHGCPHVVVFHGEDWTAKDVESFQRGIDYAQTWFGDTPQGSEHDLQDRLAQLQAENQQLKDSLQWYISGHVSSIFRQVGFDGALGARQQSTQRFWDEYNGGDRRG